MLLSPISEMSLRLYIFIFWIAKVTRAKNFHVLGTSVFLTAVRLVPGKVK